MSTPILALHVPDGFLSMPVSAIGWLIGLIAIGAALTLLRRKNPQMAQTGAVAGFIFAAQMLNFHINGGTSGHLIGGVLAVILLGRPSAILAMSSVVALQAIVFQDGGILALGFNVVNMGVISVLAGFAVYQALSKMTGGTDRSRLISAAVAAWVSVEVAAFATALQLAASGTSPLNIALPAMMGVHALIGIGEALITVGALVIVRQMSKTSLVTSRQEAARGGVWIGVGLAFALLLAVVSPLASPNPDGLERVAEDHGFIVLAQDPTYNIFPDYTVPFIDDAALTTIAAGIIGVLLTIGLSYGASKLLVKRT